MGCLQGEDCKQDLHRKGVVSVYIHACRQRGLFDEKDATTVCTFEAVLQCSNQQYEADGEGR